MLFEVNPSVLAWARREAGYENLLEAADALRIPVEALEAIESGTTKPNLAVLRKMAAKYRRPLYALAMPAPPPPSPKPEDFRTVRGKAPQLSVKAMLAIRMVRERQRAASELAEAISKGTGAAGIPRIALRDDPSEVADSIRGQTRVSIDDQFGWPSATHALRTWRWKVEDLGVLVFRGSVSRSDFRGFSLWPDAVLFPAILLNSKETEEAQIFTLIHEFAHVALRLTGICQERDRGIDKAKVERFANLVAASVLMPQDAVRSVALEVGGRIQNRRWNDDELSRMARRFRVSPLSFALRLEELDLAPPGLFDVLAKDREQWQWRSRGFGRAKIHEKQLSQLGSRYSSLVLGAHDSGLVTALDANRMLGLGPGHFDNLRSTLRDRANVYRG